MFNRYSWHRHACGSDDAKTYYMNFSDACVTPDDSSIQNMLTVDEAWIIRPDAAACPNKHLSTAIDTDDKDDDIISVASFSDSSASKLSTLNILLICLSSIFFTSSVVLGCFVYKLIPRKAPLANSQMKEIFDNLVHLDEKTAFSSSHLDEKTAFSSSP